MPTHRPTIRDVAHLAGVSHQTVSRVINNMPLVSNDTRQRVQDAIRALGYKPNAIARSMAQGHTYTLACLAPNLIDYTFASIIEGAVTEARRHGYFLLSAPADDEESFAGLVDQMVNSRRADGLMVINPYIDGRFHYLSPQYPVVYVGAVPRGEPYNSVSLNNREGAITAIHHLINLGHTHIGMITGPLSDDSAVERVSGYRQAMLEGGLPVFEELIYYGDWTATSGYSAFQFLMRNNIKPTAVFAQNDRMAIGLMRAAADAGLQIPRDISIIGFDNMPLASYFCPPMTTMHQDMAEIGKIAADLLIKKIENPMEAPQNLILKAELVVRSSTRVFNGNS